jgi:DNA topoisomerase-1
MATMTPTDTFQETIAAPKPPLRELGTDPVSQRPVVAKDGRFGVYVTDGETNASLGRGDRLEEMSPERAYELLSIRRETAGDKPAKKAAGARKAPAKKTGAKKAGGAKKAAPRKAAAKKAP